MANHLFVREEKLKSHKEISRLFGGKAQSFGQYPLRLVWQEAEEKRSEFAVQFALSVPKKRFKRAVQRNRLRRRVREAYRLHKHELYDQLPPEGPQYAWMVLYTGQEEMEYSIIETAMRQVIRRFLKQIRTKS